MICKNIISLFLLYLDICLSISYILPKLSSMFLLSNKIITWNILLSQGIFPLPIFCFITCLHKTGLCYLCKFFVLKILTKNTKPFDVVSSLLFALYISPTLDISKANFWIHLITQLSFRAHSSTPSLSRDILTLLCWRIPCVCFKGVKT